MQYRRLGNSSLQISALSFGAWVTFSRQVDVDLAAELMGTAYDAGVNFFDNAEVYAYGKAELVMGEALRRLAWPRDSYLVSSKVFWGGVADARPTQHGLSRKHIKEACQQAIGRLQVEYLDLYFCHRPDPEASIEEIVRAMSELIQQGKVFYWGTSEWPADQIMAAWKIAREEHLIPPAMEQPEYNMFERKRVEVEFAPLYDQIGLGTTTWSPLASGLLTGKYSGKIPKGSRMTVVGYEWLKEDHESDEGRVKQEKVKKLAVIAAELGTSMPCLAIAWCLKNPHVSSVLTGASKRSQLQENLKALEVVEALNGEVMERIEAILDNKPAQSS